MDPAQPPHTGADGELHDPWPDPPVIPDPPPRVFGPDELRAGQWPPAVPHDFEGADGTCSRCGVFFLDADGLCTGGRSP